MLLKHKIFKTFRIYAFENLIVLPICITLEFVFQGKIDFMDIFRIEGPVRLGIGQNKRLKKFIPADNGGDAVAAGKSTLKKVPNLSDIDVLMQILGTLGTKVERGANGDIHIDATVVDHPIGEYDMVRKMRASICILGPLLAVPAGLRNLCRAAASGDRPVDIHLRGLAELGERFISKTVTSLPRHRRAGWSARIFSSAGHSARPCLARIM